MKERAKLPDPVMAVHRVVTDAAWIQAGVVSKQAFVPRPIDKGCLSLLDNGKDQRGAHEEWQAAFGSTNPAQACLTRSVGDFNTLGVDVYATPSKRLASHAEADFETVPVADIDVVATLLAEGCAVWRAGP